MNSGRRRSKSSGRSRWKRRRKSSEERRSRWRRLRMEIFDLISLVCSFCPGVPTAIVSPAAALTPPGHNTSFRSIHAIGGHPH